MTTRTRRRLGLFAVLLLAGVFWSVVWSGMDRSVLSRVPILDESLYLRRGAELAEGHGAARGPFVMSPLYSCLVAVTGSGRDLDDDGLRLGPPPRGLRALQATLWLGTAWLLLRVGRRRLGPRWGWGPPLLWLGYAPAAILAGQVLLEVPLTFAATAALAVATGDVGPSAPGRRAWVSGLLFGVATVLRGTSAVLAVPLILAQRRAGGTTGRTWAFFLVSALLLPLVFSVWNSVLVGGPAPPSLNAGVNLYIGNGEEASGFFRVFDGFDAERDPSGAAYLSEELGRPVPDARAADRAWREAAVEDMTARPLDTFVLWLRKVRLHVTGVEIPQISSFDAWKRSAPLLNVLVVPYALLAAGGLLGAWLGRRAGLGIWWQAGGLIIAAQSLFFVVSRYRLILVPLLALGTVLAVREISRRRKWDLAGALGLAAAAALAVLPWGLAESRRTLTAGGLDNEAVRWEHVAAADAAEAEVATAAALGLYERSRAMDPERVEPWRGLGRTAWREGRHEEAVALMRSALGQVLVQGPVREDLINMLMDLDRRAEVLPYLDAALRESPDDPDLLHNTTVALAGTGRVEQALETARRLSALHPDDPRGYLDLGVLLTRQGRLPEARDVLVAGLEIAPGHASLVANLRQVMELLAADRADSSAGDPGAGR